MTVLTLDEFRTVAPEKELKAKLREDAFMLRDPITASLKAGYAHALKGFIRFMRYGVKSSSMENNFHEVLQAFREAALENYMQRTEGVEAG